MKKKDLISFRSKRVLDIIFRKEMESAEHEEMELGGIDTEYASMELGDIGMEMDFVMDEIMDIELEEMQAGVETEFEVEYYADDGYMGQMETEVSEAFHGALDALAEETGGVIIGQYIPRVVTEEEIAAYQETGGDLMLRAEVEDAIFRGMWVEMGLTSQDMVEFGGESEVLIEAVDAGVITQAQGDELASPILTQEEIIGIIEQGPTVQFWGTTTCIALDMEEHILGNYLLEVGRPDLLDHIIVLTDDEHREVSTALGEGGWIVGGSWGGGGGGETEASPVRAVGGRVREVLTYMVDDFEGERFEEDRIGEGEEQQERGCIGGIIDERTCGNCLSKIGTCGPLSELPKPPFHKDCRCGIYRQ